MKHKISDWDKLIKKIEKANKDPKFKEAVREFISYHTGKAS